MASGAHAADPSPQAPGPVMSDPDKLRQDLGTEYYAIVHVITDYDQRLVVVKGWSVTLSLAALGLGFQQGHYALFGLAALTAAGFWFIDVLYKGYQLRYYSRMRDIEVAGHHLNRVPLPELGEMSAPRIDMYWNFKGFADGGPDPRVADHDARHRRRTRRTSAPARPGAETPTSCAGCYASPGGCRRWHSRTWSPWCSGPRCSWQRQRRAGTGEPGAVGRRPWSGPRR